MIAILLRIISIIRRAFKRYPFLFGGGLIFLVCVLAYGQIVGMYFFLEDYLVLYSIQHPSAPEAGYGSGVFGRPYGYAVTPFVPFYQLFGLNPFGYYFIEIILYFLAALAVYFFAKTLTGSRKVALGSALIFASGYVGSESLYRLAVGWQNLLAAIFISLTCAVYYKYAKSGKNRLYLLALLAYLFTSEFSFYRAEGIILLILGIEILFNFKLLRSALRLVPFFLSYWYFYVYSIRSTMDQASKVSAFVQKIFGERNFHFLLAPFKTLENVFIPDQFNFPLMVFIGILFCILVWRKSKQSFSVNKVLLYCLIFVAANYIVYFYATPGASQETTQRYLTISFVGVATFWGIFLNEVFKNTWKYLFFCMLIIVLNLTLVRNDQANILRNRSRPTWEFWQSFRREVPYLSKQSVIYIDSRKDGISKPARDASLGAGSMSATTSFAVYYGLKWEDIYLAETFPELLNYVKTGKVNSDNIHTFFYSRQGGLVNTTEEVKTALFGTGNDENINSWDNMSVPYYSPVLLKFSSVTDIDFSNINSIENQVNLSRYLSFLLSREHYWDTVSAISTSEAEYAEIGNIKDQDKDSSWRANDLTWSKKHKEEVVLNLGEVMQIGAVRIIPASLQRLQTKYSYECSLDGMIWKQLVNLQKKNDKTEPFTDKFKDANCAFIKLTIYDTVSSGPPQISEIEVLENRFADLDIGLAEEVEKDPFKFMKSADDRQIILEYFANNGISGKICIHTDKYEPLEPICKKYKFRVGVDNHGELFIDQGGTLIKRIEFLLPSQVKLSIKNTAIEYQSFTQLERKGYIAKHAN